jgi:hypothetical protein
MWLKSNCSSHLPQAHRGLGIAVQTWYPPRSKLGTVAAQALDAVLAQIGNRYQRLNS